MNDPAPNQPTESREEALRTLKASKNGVRGAHDELVALAYEELRRLATRFMRGQPHEHTLQATALVNEAYIRLFADDSRDFEDRRHFLAAASLAMRSVLTDHARVKSAKKRTPPGERSVLDEILDAYERKSVDLLALDEALGQLREIDPQATSVIELRFIGGWSVSETAEILGISTRTVERDWNSARAWLRGQIG